MEWQLIWHSTAAKQVSLPTCQARWSDSASGIALPLTEQRCLPQSYGYWKSVSGPGNSRSLLHYIFILCVRTPNSIDPQIHFNKYKKLQDMNPGPLDQEVTGGSTTYTKNHDPYWTNSLRSFGSGAISTTGYRTVAVTYVFYRIGHRKIPLSTAFLKQKVTRNRLMLRKIFSCTKLMNTCELVNHKYFTIVKYNFESNCPIQTELGEHGLTHLLG